MKLTPRLLLYIYYLTAPATATAAPGMWHCLCGFFILLLNRCFIYCAVLLFTLVGGHKHFAAVGTCRALLEASVQNYITDHAKYVNNTKNNKCNFSMTAKTTVSDALDHMLVCAGNLHTWSKFQKNAKLCTSAPGKAVYKQLSERIHFEMQPSENKANIPDWMEPISKRFLIRLLLAQNYEVSIITTDGTTRPPVAGELDIS
jgi:hypothetical protein